MTYLEPATPMHLDLPGLTLHECGASIVGDIDRPAVIRAIGALLGQESMTRWQVGDLMAALIHDDDDDAAGTLQAVASELRTRYTQAWLTGALVVAQRVPTENRRAGLSWGHHEAVSHLDHDEQNRWLSAAGLHRWSIRDLAAALDAEANEGQGELPLPPSLPRPPASQLRQLLDADPEAWVLWQPATGTLRPGAPA